MVVENGNGNGNDDTVQVKQDSVLIQIEDETKDRVIVGAVEAIRCEEEIGEFVEVSPPEEARKKQQRRTIGDYFSKSGGK